MRIAIGIDVSKNKSDVVAKSESGETVYGPVTVLHNRSELTELAEKLNGLGDTQLVLMENTSMYWRQPAYFLHEAGFEVAVINAILVHAFGNNTIRNVKTDKADANKIAEYALTYWDEIRRFKPEDEVRELLKMECRLYDKTVTLVGAMKNNLIAIADQTIPDINTFFGQTTPGANGHYKWVDFVISFWHRKCVISGTEEDFTQKYREWCLENNYKFRMLTASRIYNKCLETIETYPYSSDTANLVRQTALTLNSLYDNLLIIKQEINGLACQLPEYDAVMKMNGCGEVIGPHIMAEVGDVRRFRNKKALIAYAGLDAPPYQSGTFVSKSRHISKRGSGVLRKNVYMAVLVILMQKKEDNPIYKYLDKKRSEGKHYYVYMVAGCAKFLRVYYGKVKEALKDEGEW